MIFLKHFKSITRDNKQIRIQIWGKASTFINTSLGFFTKHIHNC
jgi:hypothetical protein